MTRDEANRKYFDTEKFKRQKRQVSPTQQVRIRENSADFCFEAFTFRETRTDSGLFPTVYRIQRVSCCAMIHGMPEMFQLFGGKPTENLSRMCRLKGAEKFLKFI
jgi:hypothetical protein